MSSAWRVWICLFDVRIQQDGLGEWCGVNLVLLELSPEMMKLSQSVEGESFDWRRWVH